MKISLITNISKEYNNVEVIINAPEVTEEVKQILNGIIQINNEKRQIIATKENKNYLVCINEIISFYSQEKNNYCKTEKGNYKIKEKLYELEEILNKDFVRISNSCIINLNYVEGFDSSFAGTIEVIFKDKTKEYVSRRRVNEVMKKIKEWRN